MRHAVERLGLDAPIRADGRDTPPGLRAPCEAVIRGDGSVPQIAAASIVAKTTRDALMRRVAMRWPHYGWASNKGYGAEAHLAALAAHGPCAHHRRSFAPVAALLAPALETAQTAD
jgi:ribonuclease HII